MPLTAQDNLSDNHKISSLSNSALIAFLFPFLFVLQNPTLKDYFEIDTGPKVYHYFLPVFIITFLPRVQLRQAAPLLIFAIAVALNIFITATVNPQLVNLALFLLFAVAATGVDDRHDGFFRSGCLLAAGAILANVVVHLPGIVETAADNIEGRAIYPTLMAGGVNIEASTFVLLLIYALPNSIAIITLCTTLIIYASKSRAVILIIIIHLLVAIRPKLLHRRSLFLIAGLLTSCIFLFIFTDAGDSILARLVDIGSDPGSIGRIMLYEAAISASDCFMFGCGVGSAQDIIKSSRVADFFENNFHNVYLQQLVEIGVFGLASYILILTSAIRTAIHSRQLNCTVVLVAVALLSLIQFTGYEIITAYFIGRGLRNS
jgi:O-antigen ligase